ncbi:hypothetical protein Tco_0001762 [Tanacetum coccineum]
MSIQLDTAYGKRVIRRIGNCLYAFSCEELALIHRISFVGYGILTLREGEFEDNRFATAKGITRRIDYSLIRNKNQRCRVLYKVEDIATFLVEYVKFGIIGKLTVTGTPT